MALSITVNKCGIPQEKRDGVMPNEVVVYNSESDQYTHTKDMCVMCGSIGAKEDGLLLICQQCAKCYHSYCINKNVTDAMLRIGWRLVLLYNV